MPTAPSLHSILDVLETPSALSFADLLERLYNLRYTGEVALHFAGGQPRTVVLSQSVSLPLMVPPLTNGSQ